MQDTGAAWDKQISTVARFLRRAAKAKRWLAPLFLSIALTLRPIVGAATVKLGYTSAAAMTITLASLATSATWVAGQEGTAIDNTSNLYLDYLITGKITTTGTAGEIRLYVIAMIDDSEWPDVFDGTDSAETVSSTNILNNLRLAWVQPVAAATTYPIQPISVASLFGGICPKKWTVFVTHSTGANLDSTAGNHEINYVGVYETIT